MFGLAIVAVGLLFLAFSLTYKCVMARKQRQREAAEVRLSDAWSRCTCVRRLYTGCHPDDAPMIALQATSIVTISRHLRRWLLLGSKK